MSNLSPHNRWSLLCFGLSGLGFFISANLLLRTFSLLADPALDSIDACSAVFGTSCDETLIGPASWQLGIPLAGWGIAYYGTLLCLLLMGWALGDAFQHEATLAALALATIGCVFGVLLSVIMLAGGAPFCPLCIIVHVINLALLPALKGMSRRTMPQLIDALRRAGSYLLGAETEAPREAAWKVVGLLTAALVATVLYQWVLVESERRVAKRQKVVDEHSLAEYERTPQRTIPISAADPRSGPSEAPARLVVFSSFQCPGCRTLATELPSLRQKFPHELAVIFKHYPLGAACNEAAEVDLHPRACEAAWAAQAAHRQNKFWSFHDSLFDSELGPDQDSDCHYRRLDRVVVAGCADGERGRTSLAVHQ
jgi:protein-disulfide isomerase